MSTAVSEFVRTDNSSPERFVPTYREKMASNRGRAPLRDQRRNSAEMGKGGAGRHRSSVGERL
jgi:hypothetical protein